jgi:hypothetical protein
MRKKEGVILLVLLMSILSTTIVLADSNSSVEESAYSCLKNKVDSTLSTLSLEEQSFALMALAYDSSSQSSLISEINDQKNSEGCWPTSCKVKDTAVATIALNYAKQPTTDSEGWLVDKEIKAKSINVYLEIDTDTKSNCTIRWDGGSTKISISADKKLSGGGNCFDSGNNGYWLKIKDSCLDKNFTVSCANDFITTLLYQKSGGDSQLWYVSDEISSASANGETQHVSNLLCFSNNGKDCDYESSLWATIALQKTGYDVKNLIPYLIVFSSDNSKLFSDTFLYYLTNSEDYLTNIVGLQKTDGYWDLASTKGKFYDTSLALLVIQSASSDATTTTKSWLEEKQDTTGCWNNNNVRDTAFLLWAGWPRAAVGGTIQEDCSDKGFYCMSQTECDDVTGTIYSNYYCSALKKCCSKPAILKSCDAQGGQECASGEVCSSSFTDASDTDSCCLGTCEEEIAITCTASGYSCKDSCATGLEEESYNFDCNNGQLCCKEVKSSGIPGIVWVLIILIIIIILLILLRNRIKLLLFKKRNGVKESGAGRTRPPFFPPSSGSGMPRQQYSQRPMPALRMIPNQLPIRQAPKRDKELDDTMRKLREMSK